MIRVDISPPRLVRDDSRTRLDADPRLQMKKDTHPQYFPKAKITCACGSTFEAGGTKEGIKVEICSKCHPYFTGKEKLIDTAGKVEKFKARRAKAAKTVKVAKKTRVKKQK